MPGAFAGVLALIAACGEDTVPTTGGFAMDYAIFQGRAITEQGLPVARATVVIFISDPGCESSFSTQTATLDANGMFRHVASIFHDRSDRLYCVDVRIEPFMNNPDLEAAAVRIDPVQFEPEMEAAPTIEVEVILSEREA